MADSVTIEIEGANELLRKFDVARRDKNRVLRQAMADAAKVCARAMRSGIPARWRSIIRAKAYIDRSDTVVAAFGLSTKTKNARGTQPKGKKINDWFKAYWLNYGTLQGRDANHKFKYPVKPRHTAAANRRKNKSGIKAQNFFDVAIKGYEAKFSNEFSKSLQAHIEQLFK